MNNKLYYGDNLDVLRTREYFPDECVDLIYLDPPFNSNRNYNVLFKSESGADSPAQITAFEDTWHWGETAETTYDDLIVHAPNKVSTAVEALMNLIDRNQMMAYLVMMTARLVELHRVLKPTGSLYLHCDPTASHYLKIVLDAIFGAEHYRNEIIWHYDGPQRPSRRNFGAKHDVIFRYSKTEKFFADEKNIIPESMLTDSELKKYKQDDEGRYFYDTPSGDYTDQSIQRLDQEGRIRRTKSGKPRVKHFLRSDSQGRVYRRKQLHDVWHDIPSIGHAGGKERLSYPTQKPLKLLERIILASSGERDIVLDPFCGCGTAVAAAHKLNRRWIGIDITHLAISLQKYRLADMFELVSGKDYEVIGEPTTVDGARALAQDSANDGRYQFEWWALSLLRAKPVGGKKGSRKGRKGADQGIDGIISFFDEDDRGRKKPQKVVVQVKSGAVKSGDIRDLKGTVEREKAAIGVFITLEKPTAAMSKEALAAGYYESPRWGRKYRRLQILTIGDLFGGASVDMPPQHGTHRRAERYKPTSVSAEGRAQKGLI